MLKSNIEKFVHWNKISIRDIATGGLLISLWVVFRAVGEINLGLTRETWGYIWMILIGLIFKPVLGIILEVVGDTLALAASQDGIGTWYWTFAVVPIAIYFIVFGLKHFIHAKNIKIWWVGIIFITVITMLTITLLLFLNKDFTWFDQGGKHSLSSLDTRIILWIFGSLLFSIQIILILWCIISKKEEAKWWTSIYALVTVVVIITMWLWGPIAMALWAGEHMPTTGGFGKLKPYLYARIAKTPIILPIYILIIGPLYKVYIEIDKILVKQGW